MRRMIKIASLTLALCLGVSACERAPESVPAEDRAPAKAPEKAPGKIPGKTAPSAVRVPLHGAKTKGSEKALVTIVELSDYACPYCSKAHKTVEQLLGDYGDRVRLAVFENPLPFHTRAKPAAKWAFAAGEQGKYWQARDLLFENQRKLDDDTFAELAKTLGLDPERLERDRNSVSADRHVEGGLTLAASLGVTGTPTFFINGQQLVGAQPADTFRKAIDGAIASAEAMVARGVRPENVYSEILKTAAPTVAKPKAEAKAKGDGAECGGHKEDCEEPADTEVVKVEVGAAPVRGPANAPVTIVVFTDFQCPFCRKAEATLRELEEQYKGKLRIAYKSYPLPMHDHARLAAKAALAAHRQGKFWEYRDALFQHQDALDRDALITQAATLGLDLARFEKDLDDPATEAAIGTDEAEAGKLGVRGTPAFFINGRRISGAQPAEAFRTVIARALAEK